MFNQQELLVFLSQYNLLTDTHYDAVCGGIATQLKNESKPSKEETLAQRWFTAGPPSTALAQQ